MLNRHFPLPFPLLCPGRCVKPLRQVAGKHGKGGEAAFSPPLFGINAERCSA